ncbi:MAG: DUF4258 domain-containing protein [Magnetococcales bacterium]|nr:DUF4258 domain-containing protein [Magnetococcales bacterium]
MFERKITLEDIHRVLLHGHVIEEYPDDTPYPSALWSGRDAKDRPLHVVVAENTGEEQWIVITVYQPDSALWQPGWATRRNKP